MKQNKARNKRKGNYKLDVSLLSGYFMSEGCVKEVYHTRGENIVNERCV